MLFARRKMTSTIHWFFLEKKINRQKSFPEKMIVICLTDDLQFDLTINKRIIENQSKKNQKTSNKKSNIRRWNHRCNHQIQRDENNQSNEWKRNLNNQVDFSISLPMDDIHWSYAGHFSWWICNRMWQRTLIHRRSTMRNWKNRSTYQSHLEYRIIWQ